MAALFEVGRASSPRATTSPRRPISRPTSSRAVVSAPRPLHLHQMPRPTTAEQHSARPGTAPTSDLPLRVGFPFAGRRPETAPHISRPAPVTVMSPRKLSPMSTNSPRNLSPGVASSSPGPWPPSIPSPPRTAPAGLSRRLAAFPPASSPRAQTPRAGSSSEAQPGDRLNGNAFQTRRQQRQQQRQEADSTEPHFPEPPTSSKGEAAPTSVPSPT